MPRYKIQIQITKETKEDEPSLARNDVAMIKIAREIDEDEIILAKSACENVGRLIGNYFVKLLREGSFTDNMAKRNGCEKYIQNLPLGLRQRQKMIDEYS